MTTKRMVTRYWKDKVLQSEHLFSSMDEELQMELFRLAPTIDTECEVDQHTEIVPTSQEPLEEDDEEIEKAAWIQCNSCQKWRKVSRDQANRYRGDRKWFCSLNMDKTKNLCSAEQESFSDFAKQAHKKNILVVLSDLLPGDLVWGSMFGYCRWPAVISCDPESNTHVYHINESYGFYHVEFLGQPHSHAWLSCAKLLLYENDSSVKSEFIKSHKKKLKTQKLSYKKCSIEEAIEEANTLQKLPNSERLLRCVFFNPDGQNPQVQPNAFASVLGKPNITSVKVPTIRIKKPTRIKKQKIGFERIRKHTVDGQISVLVKKQNQTEDDIHGCNSPVIKTLENKSIQTGGSIQFELCKETNRPGVPPYLLNVTQRPTSLPKNPISIMERGTNNTLENSLLNLSREQKLSLDIEKYRKCEARFTMDLKQFLARNNIQLEVAVWENVTINLYQLFQTVLYLEGFEMVSHNMKWSEIYREVTNTFKKNKGRLVRRYYQRNLYAYELYKSDRDYKPAILQIVNQEILIEKQVLTKRITKKSLRANEVVKCLTSDDVSDISSGLVRTLVEMEQYNSMCQFEEDINIAQNKLGICIRYHDDSSPIFSVDYNEVPLADTASLCGFSAQLPEEEGFQDVPDTNGLYSDHSCSVHSRTNNSTSCSSSSVKSADFEQLQVLKDQIEYLNYEINL